jgi:hypothetical protein
MFVILSRGRRKYHLLFALLLFAAAFWDLGIFLVMIRNSFLNEIVLYHNLLSIPFSFFPAFVYHFTTIYLNQPRNKSTIVLYAFCSLGPIGGLTGVYQTYSGIYSYNWGNIGRIELTAPTIIWYLVYYLSILVSCWFLMRAHRQESSYVTRRHIAYIFVSFIVFSVALIKCWPSFGVDIPFLLPLGILVIGTFGALIGVAIIKDQLFDITVLVRKGIVYSALAAFIIIILDFSQHLIATFLGNMAGEGSTYIHFVSIGVVVVAFTPIKQRLERTLDKILAKKKIEL